MQEIEIAFEQFGQAIKYHINKTHYYIYLFLKFISVKNSCYSCSESIIIWLILIDQN